MAVPVFVGAVESKKPTVRSDGTFNAGAVVSRTTMRWTALVVDELLVAVQVRAVTLSGRGEPAGRP